MSITPLEIARMAIAAAYEMLEKEGLSSEAPHFPRALKQAIAEREEVLTVTITTPTGDAGPLKMKVAETLKARLGRDVEIVEEKDPTLLGGALIAFGDQRIDLTMRGALDTVAQELLSSTPSL
ncbi:MAG: F0F1 ATP synthase subunit delta [Candidatus Peregrinibacteria bacterium]|nr:F0F1 ATP synthase subunit delta [Candidatus Peregrinibacteria bacterium]